MSSEVPTLDATAPARTRAVRPDPLPPPRITWHQMRRIVHVCCVALFVALPFFDVLRFDIPKERFYIAGQELWINEFGIVFFTLMLLMFVVAAVSMIYGRLYCSYMCPQMIFSEAAYSAEEWIRKSVNKRFIDWSPRVRQLAAATVFYAGLLVVSTFLAFVFISYFVEPRDLAGRLASFDLVTAGGFAGAVTTIITFLDFAFVRTKFCTTVCPYGYLQGMLADGSTLLVDYTDTPKTCIECRKCVRVCHMGIDIRTSAHQIECIHCGECIDACQDVLGRLGRPTLIDYRWGKSGTALSGSSEPWYKRIGLRDAKRVVVLLVLTFYASGLAVALSLREPVLVKVTPDRTRLSWTGEAGETINKYRVTLANRGSEPALVTFSLDGLPEGRLRLDPNPARLAAGETRQVEAEISVPAGARAVSSRPITLGARVEPSGESLSFPSTFVMPTGARTRP
jgi:cytochrome c oxidase accessory protein FixG